MANSQCINAQAGGSSWGDFIGTVKYGTGGGGGPGNGGQNPFNLEDTWGRYHRTYTKSGSVVYDRSDFATSQGGFANKGIQVTSGSSDTDPRVIMDAHGILYVTFARSGNTYQTLSWDDGKTWNTPSMVISGGTHPTIAIGIDGTIILAAYVDDGSGHNTGTIQATKQAPGDLTPSAVFTFKDGSGNPISVANDTFHIQQGREGPARWFLHAVPAGGSGTKDYWSADLGQTDSGGNPVGTWTGI